MAVTMEEEMIRAHWSSLLGRGKHQAALDRVARRFPEEMSIRIPFVDLIEEGPDFAESFMLQPKIHFEVVKSILSEFLPEEVAGGVKVRIYGIPKNRREAIRNLRSKHIGTFVSVEGIIRRITEVHPKLYKAVFVQRRRGGEVREVEVTGTRIPRVESRMVLDSARSVFRDYQRLEIQELPESITGGTTPARLRAELYDDLTGRLFPGDRVVLNGILELREKGPGRAEFDLVLNVNSFEYMEGEPEELKITEEDEERIRELARGDVFDRLIRSIAPSIYGHETLKEALALQLFGGVPKRLPDGTRIRGDIHILLVGDPGTAKSQLLRYMASLAPRGLYTHGRGTTAAGLTAAAVKDEFGEGRWTLEAGALVLADQGLVAIDEIDKMSDQDRVAMHEAMEQQVVSISKAGITATLQARTSILGAANPKYGRFSENLDISEQINLPTTLISRFDALFVMTDRPNEAYDRALAEHIVRAHEVGERMSAGQEVTVEGITPEIDPVLLKKYVLYARRNVFPVMTEAAKRRIVDFFVDLRKSSTEKISITPRQLESIIRFAEASARARLSPTVEVADAEKAIKIIEFWINKVLGGDIDIFMSGARTSRRSMAITILRVLDELSGEYPDGVPADVLKERVRDEMSRYGGKYNDVDFEKALSSLEAQGDIARFRGNRLQRVRGG